MFRANRRRAADIAARFCDGCAEFTAAAERARRRYDRNRTDIHALIWPR
ncbi:hypothetical protein AB0B57_03265 [Micromonospora sp. NPDC049101]